MIISTIIPTHNPNMNLLHDVLESLFCQEIDGRFSFEVIVVDNASNPPLKSVVEAAGARSPVVVRYVREEVRGYVWAVNRGAREARGEWITFLDDDELAHPRWLAEFYSVAVDKGIECIGGSVYLDLPNSIQFDPGPRVREMLGETDLDFGSEPRPYPSGHTPGGGNAFIRKSLFQKLGGFDPNFARSTDVDFFMRVLEQGCTIWYAPKALIHHIIPPSRLTRAYLRSLTLETGVHRALNNYYHLGIWRLVRFAAWRLGVALGRDVPLELIAMALGNYSLQLDCRCGIWYTKGYLHSACRLLFREDYQT